jgi:large subunit ribosomal protein L10
MRAEIAAFWLIEARRAILDPFHQRPLVTEKSVEGPGFARRPTQEDEATAFCMRPDLSASGRSSFHRPCGPNHEEACMAKADKATAVADIAEQFKGSTATLVTEYRGLTVANLKELRRSLGDSATYTVAKNTLVKRAAAEAGIEGLDELFIGPTAIAFVKGEAVDAAKAIKKFAKDNKALVIKGGYMDGRPLSISEVEQIADLESREVLLAKLAGAMKANLSKAAGLFNAPASQVARLAAALQEKKAAEEAA